ncbi:MAG TPA: cytochrome o ubiquinol oxidase subunit IV [Parachlamydiaceae bacterium]|nr:cytochrome o ubiquinol oxidase subunit IV [Parachlamydiaceae bacterium]
MESELSLAEMKKEWHGSLKAYAVGFFTSLILTSISFSLVVFNLLSGNTLLYTIVSLALIQAVIQLLFFLHVGQEAKPKWETAIFFLMFLILLIIVIGSLWIMYDLNARMMPDMAEMMKKTESGL